MTDMQTPVPKRKATVRLSQRELSRISLAVVLVIVGLLLFGLFRVFQGFKSSRDIVIAQDNLLALHKAMRQYAGDWDNRLPDAEKWRDSTLGYLSAPPHKPGGAMAYLHGPGDNGTVGYVYNDLASGYNVETGKTSKEKTGVEMPVDPSRLVVLIERPDAPDNAHVRIPPQGNAQGEAALYKELTFPHNSQDEVNATTLVLFADGSVSRLLRRDFKK